MRRFLAAAATTSFALTCLTGCFMADVTLNVGEDGRADGSMVLAIEEGYSGPGAGSRSDTDVIAEVAELVADDIEEEGGTVESEPWQDQGYVGQRLTFNDTDAQAALNSLSAGSQVGDEVTLDRDGDEWTLSGTFDLRAFVELAAPSLAGEADGESSVDAVAAEAQDARVRVGVTLPGTLLETDGARYDDTSFWAVPYDAPLGVNAVSSTDPAAGRDPVGDPGADTGADTGALALAAAVAVGAGLLLALGAWFLFLTPRGAALLRRRTHTGADLQADGQPGTASDRQIDADAEASPAPGDTAVSNQDEPTGPARAAEPASPRRGARGGARRATRTDQPVGTAGTVSAAPAATASTRSAPSDVEDWISDAVQEGHAQPVMEPVMEPVVTAPERPAAIAAGWYQTADKTSWRWHDGTTWTDHTRPV